MSFCTVINCMDGRVQTQVNGFLRGRFGADHVDTVSDAGPIGPLAASLEDPVSVSILRRVDVSVDAHGSTQIAVVAHHDCAGNPRSKEEQLVQLNAALRAIAGRYPGAEVIGLWVDKDWTVREIAG